jgi:hypothetical protein
LAIRTTDASTEHLVLLHDGWRVLEVSGAEHEIAADGASVTIRSPHSDDARIRIARPYDGELAPPRRSGVALELDADDGPLIELALRTPMV